MRIIFLRTFRKEFRRRVRGSSEWTIYAQDPVSALAALSIRTSPSQRVILAVHFNVSQAEEMANRGLIGRNDWFYRLIRRQEREVMERVDGVVFFSRYMQRVVEELGISLRSSVVIPHSTAIPVPDAHFEPRDLIAIGSLEPRKNQVYILRVLHEAALRGRHYRLTLVGSGEDRGKLESLARELNLEEQVYFTGRYAAASSLLTAHRVFVHAAKIENFPIALVEALAAGRPILAPAVGGIPEVFRDGVEGLFWPLDDPAKGACLLMRILEDDGLRDEMSRTAFERYRHSFDRCAIHQKLFSYVIAAGVEGSTEDTCTAGPGDVEIDTNHQVHDNCAD